MGVGISDICSDVSGRMFQKPNTSGVAICFNDVNGGVTGVGPKGGDFTKRNMNKRHLI